MLEMRPDCEACGRDLPPDAKDALICSFECTWCKDCVDGPLDGKCRNCGGDLHRRPTRVGAALEKYPGSTTRRFKG